MKTNYMTHTALCEEYHDKENRQKSLFSRTLPTSVGKETINKICKLCSIVDHGKCYGNSKARKEA